MQQKIIFFGSGYYVIPVVEKLRRHNLQLVITTEVEGEFINYLKNKQIPFLQSKLKKPEDIEKIKEFNPTLGILASYGAIIPKKIIDIFPLGIFNIHPSLLPKYKGPSPVQFTILNGENETGVTVIRLDDQIDHGPVLTQEKIQLKGDETLKSLTEKLFALGADLITKIIQNIEKSQTLNDKNQSHNNETFTRKVIKKDGFIDIANPPKPEDLDRKIRAFFPWPGVYLNTSLNNQLKIIKLFPQKKIQVEGKKIMSFKDFTNGYEQGKDILKSLFLTE